MEGTQISIFGHLIPEGDLNIRETFKIILDSSLASKAVW